MADDISTTIKGIENRVVTAVSISPNSPDNVGLDYEALRAAGVQLTQQLSSDIWTDYNESDPGVTTLEQLCYALTELSYRADFAVQDLLTDPDTQELQLRRHGLFPARNILPCNPITVNDYRKLIADRVPGVANVWLTAHQQPTNSPSPISPSTISPSTISPDYVDHVAVNGLYDIRIYAPGVHDPCHDHHYYHPPRPHRHNHSHNDHRHNHHHYHHWGDASRLETPERLLSAVRRVYNRFRNLCEDIHSIQLLLPLCTVVHATVDVRDGKNESVEKTLAQILFDVGKLCAPELQRQSLRSQIEAGETTDEIFNGPLLRRGFVADDQLQPQMTSLAVNAIIGAMAHVDGVLGVRTIEVHTGDGISRANQSIAIPTDGYLDLDTEPDPDWNGFSIRLFRNGVACHPNPDIVRMELSLLWAGYRRNYPLEAQYEEYFGIAKTTWRDLEQYYSVQNQYPAVYGIGVNGLPPGTSARRYAQARQLKGYLLPFEQLMADFFAQLAHVGDLFSIDPDSWQTYYWQSLSQSVPDVAPLLTSDYEKGMQEIVSSADNIPVRRSQLLEFLLALYASELTLGSDATCSIDTETTRLFRSRLEYMRRLTRSTRSRARAVDTLGPISPTNIAGMEIKCRIQMGLDLDDHPPFRERLAPMNWKLVRDNPDWPAQGIEDRHFSHIEKQFRRLSTYPEPDDLSKPSDPLQGITITEEFLAAARDPANLFIGTLPGEDRVLIVYWSDAFAGWIFIGALPDSDRAIVEAYALCRLIATLYRTMTQLYIVEHILLRFQNSHMLNDDEDFVYSLTLTSVVGLPSEEWKRDDKRRIIERIIRDNTPAHLVAEVCFLDPHQLREFEDLYFRWRRVLRTTNFPDIVQASAQLRQYLEHHQNRSKDSDD